MILLVSMDFIFIFTPQFPNLHTQNCPLSSTLQILAHRLLSQVCQQLRCSQSVHSCILSVAHHPCGRPPMWHRTSPPEQLAPFKLLATSMMPLSPLRWTSMSNLADVHFQHCHPTLSHHLLWTILLASLLATDTHVSFNQFVPQRQQKGNLYLPYIVGSCLSLKLTSGF